MHACSRSRSRLFRGSLLFGLLAVAAGLILMPSGQTVAAQPAAAIPAELRYVPADAALFLHADAAKIWSGDLGKSLRGADSKMIDGLIKQGKELFGVTPDQLKNVTLFFPKIKNGPESESFAVVFTFNAAFDKEKLKAGFDKLFPPRTKFTLHSPSDRIAILLVGLSDDYAKPRADQTGPLAGAIREAASGKHALVAGTTLANLPDEIRADDVPAQVRAFQPLFHAESITGFVDLGKDITLEVRVKAGTAAKAVEAEKALGAVAALIQEGLTEAFKAVDKDAAKEPLMKDLLSLIKAAQAGVKGAKYSTEGTETRVTLKVPADLPYGPALMGAVAKVRDSAANAQSANNLKQIALALHNYHDTHNAFPPAAVCDKAGKPMLSWRVLILPYIEQAELYREFKLDEAWDGPTNKKLLAKMPKVYAIPGTDDAKELKTHYRVFVGNGALFDYLRGPKLQDVADGTSNTIMVVTAAESVPWTKPDELAFDPDKDMGKLLGAVVNGRIQTAFADGSVRTLSKVPAKKTLNALITRAGGEVIDFDD